MSFLRAEACICGTSTTGTGTLTLAACPSPPGGVDLYAAFQGQGLGTSQTIPTTYTIIEYTNSGFGTAKQMEKGVGALTIGASVTATTLARTTPQSTATSMNTSTPTYSTGSPSAISIGTAANVLVFVGASAADVPAWSPYYETTLGDNKGATPCSGITSAAAANFTIGTAGGGTTGCDAYFLFEWRVPMLVKRCTVNVQTAGSGGNSNCDARLYGIASTGRPGKLLYDFGLLGTSNTSFHSTGLVSTGASGSGFMLLPGEYYLNLCDVETDSVNAILTAVGPNNSYVISGRMGSALAGRSLTGVATATNPVIGAAPDPADTTSYALKNSGSNATPVTFALNSS